MNKLEFIIKYSRLINHIQKYVSTILHSCTDLGKKKLKKAHKSILGDKF